MVLLQICVEGNIGSTGTMAEAIGKVAIQKGWDSHIAYGRFPRGSASNLIRIGSNFETIIHAIESRLFDNHGFGSRYATKRLIRKILTIKPDIIHLHHLHGYYVNIEILFEFLKRYNVPVVWTFHDCWSFTGHCTHFDFVGCEKWKTQCYSCPQLKQYPKSFFFDNSKMNYRKKKKIFTSISNLTIVSVSDWLNKQVSNSFFKKTSHLRIHNGIDLSIFKSSDRSITTKIKYGVLNKFVILGVASTWSNRKGLEDFFKLSNFLKDDETIILVGLDSHQIRSLPKNILGLSRTESKEDLADLYNAADVYINLSVEETFGLTTAESMACGSPVIAYNSTASPELLDPKTGVIVEKGDLKGVYNAIQLVKRNTKDYYSFECEKSASKKFNLNERLNDYFELYNKIILLN